MARHRDPRCRRGGWPASALAHRCPPWRGACGPASQDDGYRLEHATIAQSDEPAIDRPPRRQTVGQQSPGATRPQHVEDRVGDRATARLGAERICARRAAAVQGFAIRRRSGRSHGAGPRGYAAGGSPGSTSSRSSTVPQPGQTTIYPRQPAPTASSQTRSRQSLSSTSRRSESVLR